MQKHDGDEEALRAVGLRPATSDDEPFLLQLFAGTRSDELAHMSENQREAFVAMQFKAQSRQYVVRYPHAHHSIILWNDTPIGRLLLDRGERELTLVDITLLPTHRGAGIGTHLLKDLLREAAAVRKPVRLKVWYSSPAKELYQRLGFSAVNDDGVYCEMWWKPGL